MGFEPLDGGRADLNGDVGAFRDFLKGQKGDIFIFKLAHKPKGRWKYQPGNNRKNENVPFLLTRHEDTKSVG